MCGTRPFLRLVQSQGRSPDVSGSPQNTSGPVGILLKIRHLRRQAINLTPPKRVKAWGTPPWGQRDLYCWGTPDRNRAVHNTTGRSVTQLLERCTNTMIGARLPTLSLTSIYGGWWVHYAESTTATKCYLRCKIISIWSVDSTLTWTSTLGQSRHGSNSNEWVLHSSKDSKTGASPSNAN